MMSRRSNINVLFPLLILGSVALGFAVVGFAWVAAMFVALTIGTGAALDARLRPVLAGALMAAYANAVPFVDLAEFRLPGGVRFDDVIMGAMLLFGIAWTAHVGRREPLGRLRTALIIVAAYWIFTLARTVLVGGNTLLLSTLYGRDFLAIAMALAVGAVSVDIPDADAFILTVLAFMCVFSIAHIVQVGAGVDMSAFMHPYKASELLGESRLYARGMSLVIPCFLVALSRALFGGGVRQWIYWSATAILGVEVLAQFTRANYLGMIASLCVGALLLGRVGTFREERRAAVGLLSGAAAGIGAWFVVGSQALRSSLGGTSVFMRFASTSSELTTGSGTFGYRLELYETMLGILAWQWPWGLGFLHPAEKYMPLLPMGEIRNNDTGIMSPIMAMGVLGLVVLVAPLALAGRWAWRVLTSTDTGATSAGWAMLTYVTWVVLTSFSLGFLAFGPGLASTAMLIGVVAGAYQRVRTLEEG